MLVKLVELRQHVLVHEPKRPASDPNIADPSLQCSISPRSLAHHTFRGLGCFQSSYSAVTHVFVVAGYDRTSD